MSGAPSFAVLGQRPLFAQPKPTGNLYRPDVERFLDYSRQFQDSVYDSDADACRNLEVRLAEYHGVARVVAVNSGFWGHVIALAALALPGRREVIAPSFGYRRTDDMIAWAGFVPHFCDVDPETLGITVETVKAELNAQTALILAPHPMVNCCDAAGIGEFARVQGIPVVFDSVEAAHRICHGRRIGGFGDAEIFSMHATKLLNAFEGGYITTNNKELARRLDNMKRFGFDAGGRFENPMGLNAKLGEVHAAMALASLDEVDRQVAANRRKYDLYAAGLNTIDGLKIVEHREAERSDYRLIVVRVTETWPLSREQTLRTLQAENILARPYYTPLHHKVVDYTRICPALPVTEAIFGELMVLPASAHVLEADVEKILDVLQNIRTHGAELKSFWNAG